MPNLTLQKILYHQFTTVMEPTGLYFFNPLKGGGALIQRVGGGCITGNTD